MCEEIETKHLLFMPASQLSSRPSKESANVINSEMEVKLFKLTEREQIYAVQEEN